VVSIQRNARNIRNAANAADATTASIVAFWSLGQRWFVAYVLLRSLRTFLRSLRTLRKSKSKVRLYYNAL